MKLMTQEIEQNLPSLYHFETTGKPAEASIKFFDPIGSWTWYVAEGEKQPDGDWLFWGLVQGFELEYGYFRLSDLEHAKDGVAGLMALPIERDLYFQPVLLKEIVKQS